MARNCENCVHSEVCAELERYRDPLWFTNTKDEFCCSSYLPADIAPRAEVAREIFQEIITTVFSKMPPDVLMVGRDCDFTDGIRMGKREAIIDMINTLAELKKKYTEGKK